jgi:tetratricopeptide (TPR) repeat protein
VDWVTIKAFLIDNAVLLGSLAAVAAIVGFLFAPIRNLLSRKKPTQTADLGPIIDRLTAEARRHGAVASELDGATQREEGLQEQVRQLSAAVEALSAERGDPDAPAGIDEALRLLGEGDTAAAEAVFEEVKARRKAEGEGALKEAAAAARHIGALAFLHDTDKALVAYREAVALDPDDPAGWNQLGLLLNRTGDIDGAIEAFNHVLSLGNRTADRAVIAVATSNLGNLYFTRGELDRAEEMYRKSLEIDEVLGSKEGMASQSGNLGVLYQTQGELDRAEEMYRKSLDLFREIGAAPQIKKAEAMLAELREAE